MLTLTDAGNNDLRLYPPPDNVREISGGTTAIGLYVVVSETDGDLPDRLVGAEVDWNDGTLPVAYPGSNQEQTSPLVINVARNLGLGTHVVTVTAHNNRAPQPDVCRVTFPWVIRQLGGGPPRRRSLFGPVLPRDDGLPNAQTWAFDTGSDADILRSNLKMLLLTTKGERIMQPAYGTNLRRILFELNAPAVEALVQQEISQAAAQYEPRVTLQRLEVIRLPDERAVTVAATFSSKLNDGSFNLNLEFTP